MLLGGLNLHVHIRFLELASNACVHGLHMLAHHVAAQMPFFSLNSNYASALQDTAVYAMQDSVGKECLMMQRLVPHPSKESRRKLHIDAQFLCATVAQLLCRVCHLSELVTGLAHTHRFCGQIAEPSLALTI